MVTFGCWRPGQNDKHHNYTWHGSYGDGRNGTPSETQFLRVVRMGFNHTCPHCEHGMSKLNEPNASICQTFLATSSPPTTNEAQVEFDHRMLCTLGTFKNHRQVLTSPRYPPRDRLTLFFAKVTRSLFCGLGTRTMTEELMRKLQPMMRMTIQRGTQVSVPQPVMPTTAKPTIPRQTKPPSLREHDESVHHADSNHEVPHVEPKDELETWVDFTVRATHTAVRFKWNRAMDLAYMCVKHQMRLYVCQALPPPKHQKRLYVCHQMRLYVCHQMRLYVCHQMRLYVCHQMRLLNSQRSSLRSLTFARFARTFFNSLN